MGAAEAAAEVLIVYLSIPNLLPPNKKRENVKPYRGAHQLSLLYPAK